MSTCSKCDDAVKIKGLCPKHYQAAYRANHAEKHAAYNAEYRSRSENKLIANAKTQAWYRNNLEKSRKAGTKRALAWAKAHPAEAKARVRAWDKAHPEEKKARLALYRARKKGAQGKHTGAEVLELFNKQHGLCAVCRCALDDSYHKDHILPLALGGSNDIGNIQLLCPPCNHTKSSKHPVDFMQERGFLL